MERICAYKYRYCSYTLLSLFSPFGLVIGLGRWSLVFGLEGVMAQSCNPPTLKPEQSCRVGSIPDRTPQLERHDKGSQTQLGLLYLCEPKSLALKNTLRLRRHKG